MIAPTSARRELALLIAPWHPDALHELTETECSAALPFAHGVKVVDFQLANLARAGLREVIVLQPGLPRSSLRDHIRRVWRPSFRRIACLGGHACAGQQDYGALHRFLALIEGVDPDDLLLLAADHICESDIAGLIAFHQAGRNLVTLGAHQAGGAGPFTDWIAALNGGARAGIGMVVLNWKWFRACLARLPGAGADLPQQVIMAASREAGLQMRDAGEAGLYWRRLDCLDTFRLAWLDFISGPGLPCSLPLPPAMAQRFNTGAGAGVLRGMGDSVVMPGASVSPRAHVSRAIIAPGAHVPDGMVIGEDPEQDARLFRVTPGGTTLVTAEMLATAAAAGF
ncbi:sugar phosphate nucleotidyltransferase [Pseudogemmobacter humi]|uniref:Glucose-1-phosphate adenylyltransferase n=1 Tax=Pseudogemmobacter humi TaxID=2483812 RepID=A0A3P5X1L5_9RHOB|nr:sugar phosphate nucleotidyltransferase [Pseudogemmobacter humi]VDC25111.1 Glucose-1-phosphate adenylyltransferase [Pseudogemmobacter humi]